MRTNYKNFLLLLFFTVAFIGKVKGDEFLVYDGTRTFVEADRGFLYFNFDDNIAPSDWTTPEDYYNGSFQVRLEILDLPTSEPFRLSICVWQNGWNDVENCSPQISLNNGEDIYTGGSTPASWWKKDGKAVDFSSPGTIQSFGVAMWNESGCIISDYSDPNCWDERVDHLPMQFRITVVAVSDGSTFSGWNNYVTPNNDPVITSSPVTNATEEVLYEYQVVATDDPGETLISSLVNPPNWLAIDDQTGLISGTPTNDDVGDVQVQVKVEDDRGGSTTQEYTLTVANVNDDPTISSTPIDTVTEGNLYQYQVVASDIDAVDVLSYDLTINPSWLSIDTGTGAVSGTPANSDVGEHDVEITVSDNNGGSAKQNYTITVKRINLKPQILNLPTNISFLTEESHVENMNNYATDDATKVSDLIWEFEVSNDKLITEFNTINRELTLTAPDFSGTVTLTCTVFDEEGASDSQDITVNVTTVTALADEISELTNNCLMQNYPNPFSSSTIIPFNLINAGNVKLNVYNIHGEEITTLINESRKAGKHEIKFKARNLPEGVYFYKLTYESHQEIGKMIYRK